MMDLKKCFIIGMPNAGKSTYLAALWYSLVNPTQNKLTLKSVEHEEYLYGLSQKWSNCEALDRTLLGEEAKDLSVNVIDVNGYEYKIMIPDLSGETFLNCYAQRTLDGDLVDYIIESDSVMLFINVADIIESALISNLSSSTEQPDDSSQKKELPTWNAYGDPMQTKAVELLQIISSLKNSYPLKLGIVLSAWDLVEELSSGELPPHYIQKQLPLLWQFLCANENKYNTQYWGVSAQGAGLEQKDDLVIMNPLDRIAVFDTTGNKHKDISLPIYMILSD